MPWYRRVLAIFLLCCCAIGSAWADDGVFPWNRDTPQFLDATNVFRLKPLQKQDGAFLAESRIADNYYVYRHSLKVVDQQGHELGLNLPAGTLKHDEFFGDTEIYTGEALRLHFPAAATGQLTLHWQGCAEAGICYPPQTMKLELPTVTDSAFSGTDSPQTNPVAEASTASANAEETAAMAEDQAAAQRLAALGPVSGTLLFFGFGLLLSLTPCTLPMIPIVSAMVVGSQAKPRRAFLLSSSYVLAMAGTYAAVGIAAGLAGANLQATLQSPWLLGTFALLFLLLASSLFGLFELRLPSALVNRIETAGGGPSGGGISGAAALGFLSALLVGPCMTAPLAGALLYIGQTGSAFQGGLALFALGLGMGLPLLAIAVFGARVLPRPGAWMESVRIAFGYLMVGMAVMMLARFLPAKAGLLLWGTWLLALAIGLLAWAQAMTPRPRLAWTLRTGAACTGLWAILMLVGVASGGESVFQPLAHLRSASTASALATTEKVSYVQAKSVEDVDARLAQAAANGQWSLIDFYADWCVSCHVIESKVFGDPVVAARLAQMQVIRPDVTHNDATDQALLKRWGVMGPPTLILVGPDGTERRELRVVGEVSAQDFMDRLDAAGAP